MSLYVQTGKATEGKHEIEEITGESEGTTGESGRKGMSTSYAQMILML